MGSLRGLKVDRSRVDGSRDSLLKRGASNASGSQQHLRNAHLRAADDSFDEFLSDGEASRRSFYIVQPHLKQDDVRQY